MKRARVIYNPSAGREQVRKQLPYILERLEKAGYEASAHATTKEGCATEAADRAAENGFALVVAAGGDGTIFEVVNGLAGQKVRPRLGIIPAGTTNDFARALGIPREIEAVCDVLCEGEARPIDIGKVGEQYFINIAAGGTLTELTYDTPSKLKTMMGQLAYYVKGFEKLRSLSPTQVTIEYDGKLFEGDIMLFLVSNTNSVGGFEKLAPNAEFDDGMFDLTIVERTSLPEFVRIASLALRGEHIHHPKVIHVEANRVKVHVEGDMQLNLDGEYGGMLPSEFENLHHHFEIMAPKRENNE
ncbi:diacylglycerol kinase [Desertibacillus haloalkaliphilus]|uniref:diacylglycerol kinase n=1 Tax=Desertibacillus haloalkaliphilus TaxID=1328930 RepID=UPI001C26DC8A|nr:diacylglycerol kinase [Desertibacillus haloalkaliphilus]MBU8906408.1 diacylglycerol kinase [Desertibacillus haloalkaliphilus]